MRAGGSLAVIICLLWCGVWEVVPIAKSDTTPSQCKEEVDRMRQNCRKALLPGRNPSAYCCQIVRAAHVECICPHVTPKLANNIPQRRTTMQMKTCGRSVPRNFKCGSITTPP
ncbi:uncharacterized protein LOC126629049 [Malus sylvestris]|uniref:uncharacterized protein LOC126629049 n=1 Tax=Malus sylvestris TaxID=3752 RepID=UPI0021AC3B4E|nr:uncharacterized protein LOC126629049 [Malus sylvestris]